MGPGSSNSSVCWLPREPSGPWLFRPLGVLENIAAGPLVERGLPVSAQLGRFLRSSAAADGSSAWLMDAALISAAERAGLSRGSPSVRTLAWVGALTVVCSRSGSRLGSCPGVRARRLDPVVGRQGSPASACLLAAVCGLLRAGAQGSIALGRGAPPGAVRRTGGRRDRAHRDWPLGALCRADELAVHLRGGRAVPRLRVRG